MSAARSGPPARPRRTNPPRWGWHRLQPDAARHVVTRAGIRPGDLVVDLGAGTGALTAAAVAAGARVVAIELHPGRLAALGERFAHDDVTVVAADLATARLPRRPFRVVANPPWALAETVRSSLLRAPALVRADLVLPRWLVHRWAAGSRRVDIGCSLRAESFVPRAPTGAAVAIIHGRRADPALAAAKPAGLGRRPLR